MTDRMGFWVDMHDAYYTLDNDYIESVWYLLKTIWDKGLIYQGYKVVPYDPRIGATLSSTRSRWATRRSKTHRSMCASGSDDDDTRPSWFGPRHLGRSLQLWRSPSTPTWTTPSWRATARPLSWPKRWWKLRCAIHRIR